MEASKQHGSPRGTQIYPQLTTDGNVDAASGSGAASATPSSYDAEELLFIESGVNLFYLAPNGDVFTPSTQPSLRIVRFPLPESMRDEPVISQMLQVGSWNYPLYPGSSPSLSADYGAYVFPNLESDVEGSCVGIILDDTIVGLEARSAFERLIEELSSVRSVSVDTSTFDAEPSRKKPCVSQTPSSDDRRAVEPSEESEGQPASTEDSSPAGRVSAGMLQKNT